MKITLAKLSTKDLATLAERTINSSQQGNFTVVENHELLLKVKKEYELYQQVYTKLTHSGKGKSVAEADSKRDQLFSGIKNYLSGFKKLPNIKGYQEAMALLEILQKYGLSLDKLSYSAETAQLKKLLEEVEKTENADKIKALQLTESFAELKKAQTDFEALYAEQAEANADLKQLPSATSIRKSLEEALRNYFNLLTAMRSVEGWKNIYSDINEIVKAAKNSKVSTTKKTS